MPENLNAREYTGHIKDLQEGVLESESGRRIGLYSVPLSDGSRIHFHATEAHDMKKEEKDIVRSIYSLCSTFSRGNLLSLFEDKEDGVAFLSNEVISLPLLLTHLNQTQTHLDINFSATTLLNYFFPTEATKFDGELPVLVCAVTSETVTEEDGSSHVELRNAFIDQANSRAFVFRQNPDIDYLAEPLRVEYLRDIDVSYYALRDVLLRLSLQGLEDEDGQVETIDSYLLPVDNTLYLLLEQEGKLPQPKTQPEALTQDVSDKE